MDLQSLSLRVGGAYSWGWNALSWGLQLASNGVIKVYTRQPAPDGTTPSCDVSMDRMLSGAMMTASALLARTMRRVR